MKRADIRELLFRLDYQPQVEVGNQIFFMATQNTVFMRFFFLNMPDDAEATEAQVVDSLVEIGLPTAAIYEALNQMMVPKRAGDPGTT